jgi:uncharacterized OsmC-like protein
MDTTVHSAAGLLQSISIGPFRLQSDEPVEVGGTGLAPTPYDLLCAALGACTSMTLKLYARTKGWPLREVRVIVRHHKIYASDCAECETREGRIDQIEREIELEGDLSDEQRQRLLAIADKCPVHRTLQREVRILTRLKGV